MLVEVVVDVAVLLLVLVLELVLLVLLVEVEVEVDVLVVLMQISHVSGQAARTVLPKISWKHLFLSAVQFKSASAVALSS